MPNVSKKNGNRFSSYKPRRSRLVFSSLAGLLVWAVLGLSSCLSLGGSGSTMNWLSYPLDPGKRQETLVVFLPGINNSPTVFANAGLVADTQELWPVDVIVADASLKFYMDRTVIDRLERDVLAPARDAGYRQIWLAGTSMGGFGALLYAQEHPTAISGVVLIAPFLGDNSTAREIKAAGGLARWNYQQGSGSDEQDRKVREIWFWLQGQIPQGSLPIFMGYGLKDRFRFDHAELAAAMPEGRSLPIPGGHDWPTWRAIWRQMVPLVRGTQQ